MAGRISQRFIDDLLDRVNIASVVDSRVKLKKSGKNYSACCPFHDEKTPSFTVSPDKQFYYCFGCGASGNAIGFVMEFERLNFPEAVEKLAADAGIEVQREAPVGNREDQIREREQQQQRKNIYSVLAKADEFYRNQLRRHPQKQQAVNYLKNRGLSGAIARDFCIGFAPPGWDNLMRAFDDEEDRRLLIEGGMLIQREDRQRAYDRFRHRIMFPIRDSRGRVIGFGGRVLGDEKPKYLNSPETPVFHKSRELYGLYEARQALRQLPRLLVVEGYMDVVALAQFGIRYGVATLGTACGEEHLRIAFKLTNEVVFCFDGDKAGRSAARRALHNSLTSMEDGRQVKFLFLPEGEDPDTLVRAVGEEKFTRLIEERAQPLEDFLFDALSEGLNTSSLEGRARLSKLAAPLLHQLPTGVYRELMFDRLARITGLDRATLNELVHEPLPELPPEPQAPDQIVKADESEQAPTNNMATTSSGEHEGPRQRQLLARQANGIHLPPLQRLTALLLNQPSLVESMGDVKALEGFEDEDLSTFKQIVSYIRSRSECKLAHIIGYWQGKHGQQAAEAINDLAAKPLIAQGPKQAPFDVGAEFHDTLRKLLRETEIRQSQGERDALKARPFHSLSDVEKQRLRELTVALQGSRQK